MQETTIYLTDELKHELERIAAEQGRSEAEIILEGIRLLVFCIWRS
jgi:predicted transcriptional regulator